ncbi:MAG: polysaccharide deacetylase family protein, partial [Dehalococcoidia bacterium]
MRNWYPLAAAGAAAAIALAVLVVVLVRAGDDDTPAAPETATPTPPVTVEVPPTATPGSPTAPVATATPTPTTVPGSPTPTATSLPATGTVFEHGDRGSNTIALTFDMGGRVDPALDIMNWLIDNEVHATIFMTGAMAENQNTDAGREVLALIDAHPDLFDLGNHSYTHPDFRDLTAQQMRDELSRTESAVAKSASMSMRPWFRPPFGGWDDEVVRTVAAAGYSGTIMWDIDTIDWRPEEDGGPTSDDIVDKV